MIRRQLLIVMLLVLALVAAVPATFALVKTGTPPFGSFSGGPDIINNANLNVHFDFPVVNKPGRGQPFSYALSYDNSVWYPSGAVWTHVNKWGWRGVTEITTGYVTYLATQGQCWWPQGPSGHYYYWHIYSVWAYHDPAGDVHSFAGSVSDWAQLGTPCGGGPPSYSMTVTADDGSGYTLAATASPSASLHTRSGALINAPLQSSSGSGSITDRNSNQISTNGLTFTDTLGMTALTASGSGTQSSPLVFTYTGPGGSVSETVRYTNKNIKTNFGCSGITEYTASSVPLVSKIDLPDGTSYTFAYEPTPGYSGYVTGRLASVTLPTGGTISYQYAGSKNGIVCADGSTATLKRFTPDTGSNYWQYAHAENGTAWTTTITDPAGNQTVINFQNIYETERQVYQGTSTLLETVDTCYNGATIPCTGTSIIGAISNRTVQVTLPGVSPAKTYTTYDTYGLPTETDEYDYGPTLVRKTTVSYDRPSGTDCGVTKSYVLDRPCAIQVYDGAPSLKAETDNTYDASGNLLTETHINTGGSPASIQRSFTYSATGVLQTSTDFNSNQTTYTNTSCNNSFPTTISLPMSLSRSMTWHCGGGVPSSVTDENSQPTSLSYENLWRPTSVDLPGGAQVSWTYNDTASPPNVVTTTKLTTSMNRIDTARYDGLGRVTQAQLADPEGDDKVDATYDDLGRTSTVSNPYRSIAEPTYGTDSYTYDALGRVTSIQHSGDSNTVQFSYSGNCATSTDEASKKRTFCTDALGRVTSVTEDPGGLAYQTTYTYDTLGNLTGVNQGGRTRTYVYDMLSRLSQAQTPESGTVNFTYDANGNVLTRVAPKPNQTGSLTVTTTYTYDALNRLTSKTYSDTTPAAYFSYDESTYAGKTLSNTKGRLSHASAAAGAAITIHSYDVAGRTTDYWQCTPYTCPGGTYWGTSYTYDLASDVASWTPPAGYTVTNQISTAQRITQVSSSLNDSTHPGTLAALTYTPWGAVKTLENGCAGASCVQRRETYEYNNRLQPYWIELGTAASPAAQFCLVYNYYQGVGTPTTCSVPSQAASGNNGNMVGYFYRDTPNSALQHKTEFTYDNLNRLTSSIATPVSPGTVSHNLDFSYDRYGNATCVTDAQTNGPCPNWTFNSNNQISTSGFSYDAAGNTTQDGTGAGTHTYQWDAEGRLKSVDDGTTASYVYNALGQRVEKLVSSAYTEIVYGLGGQPIGYHNRTDWTDQFFYLGAAPFAKYQGNVTYFIHGNHLGSTSMVFNHTGGTVAQDEIFYPWGERWDYAGTLYDERFASLGRRDAETGNDPTLFRMYESRLYRWLSPDPGAGSIYNPQSLNRYAYVLNNPVSFIDPLGLDGTPPPGMVCEPSDKDCKHPHRPSCTTMGCVWQYYGNTICFIGGHMGPCPMSQGYFNTGRTDHGYDIFDAMMGAPGTYLTLDIYGNVGFGFDEELWMRTWAFVDYEQSRNRAGLVPISGYVVNKDWDPVQRATSATPAENLAEPKGLIPSVYGKEFRKPGTINQFDWSSITLIQGPGGVIIGGVPNPYTGGRTWLFPYPW